MKSFTNRFWTTAEGGLFRRETVGEGGHVADLSSLIVANVTEAGDIVLYATMLAATLGVGLTLFGIDALVGRLRDRRARARPPQ